MSLASTAVGATTGNTTDALAAGQASENAVENNFGFTENSYFREDFEGFAGGVEQEYLKAEQYVEENPEEIATYVGYTADAVSLLPAGKVVKPIAGTISIFTDFFNAFITGDYNSAAAGFFGGSTTKKYLNRYDNIISEDNIDRVEVFSSQVMKNIAEE